MFPGLLSTDTAVALWQTGSGQWAVSMVVLVDSCSRLRLTGSKDGAFSWAIGRIQKGHPMTDNPVWGQPLD